MRGQAAEKCGLPPHGGRAREQGGIGLHTPPDKAEAEPAPRQAKWAGLIAAAGDSVRMGSPKALLETGDGLTFVEALSQAYLQAGLSPVIVTVPPAPVGEMIAERLAGLAVCVTPNSAPHRGLSGSVETALSSLRPEHAGLVLCPVDAPFASAPLISAMLDALEAPDGNWRAAVASYDDLPGHPVAFSRDLFEDLLDCDRSGGPRAVLKAHASRVLHYAWNDPNILQNLNTPEAYREAYPADDSGVEG